MRVRILVSASQNAQLAQKAGAFDIESPDETIVEKFTMTQSLEGILQASTSLEFDMPGEDSVGMMSAFDD